MGADEGPSPCAGGGRVWRHEASLVAQLSGKESVWSAGDPGWIPGSGRSPGRGDGLPTPKFLGFPGGSAGKESTCNAGDPGLIPGSGKSSGEENRLPTPVFLGFPCGSAGKESTCNAGDLGSIPALGRSPGDGKGYPLQYSDLENSMDCIVHGVAKSWTWLCSVHVLQKTGIAVYCWSCSQHQSS